MKRSDLWRWAAAAAFLAGSGCAPAIFTPPSGPGAPAPRAADVWQATLARCSGISSVRAELTVTGRAGSRRIPGLAGARLATAVNAGGELAIEIYVSGQQVVRLAGTAGDATLLLRDGPRVVRAGAADIVDALVGVKLDPAVWRGVLTACPAPAAAFAGARRYDEVLAVTAGETTVYLKEQDASWRLRAARWPALAVDYSSMRGDLPRAFTVRASDVRLGLTVRDLAINPTLDPDVFVVRVPANAEAMSLDELRTAGPMGAS